MNRLGFGYLDIVVTGNFQDTHKKLNPIKDVCCFRGTFSVPYFHGATVVKITNVNSRIVFENSTVSTACINVISTYVAQRFNIFASSTSRPKLENCRFHGLEDFECCLNLFVSERVAT